MRRAEARSRRLEASEWARAALCGVLLVLGCNDDEVPAPPDLGTQADLLTPPDQSECLPTTLLCNGVCVDSNTDPENCGRCDHACGAGIRCVGGACEEAACAGLLGLPGPPIAMSIGAQIALADLEGDGSVDVIGGDTKVLRVALNRGNAVFRAAVTYPTLNRFAGVDGIFGGPNLAVGDFNGDGLVDVVQMNAAGNGFSTLTNQGQGRLNQAVLTSVGDLGFYGLGVIGADLDGDGRFDVGILAPDFMNGVNWQLWKATNKGNGAFAPVPLWGTFDQVEHFASGDVDGDGAVDLAVAGASHVMLFMNEGQGNFRAPVEVPLQMPIHRVAIADMDGDGKRDLVVCGASAVAVVRNLGDGRFAQSPIFQPSGNDQVSISTVDMTGDGATDVVIANADIMHKSGFSVAILTNDGTGRLGSLAEYAAGPYATFGAVGDMDGDGRPDVAVAHGSGDVSVLLNSEKGRLNAPASYDVGAAPRFIAAGDFDGDGRVDLAFTNSGSTTATVRWNDGNGGFGSGSTLAVGNRPQNVAAADLDDDKMDDLAVPNLDDGTVSVLFSSGGRTFKAQIIVPVGEQPSHVGIGDVNGDGRKDLIVSSDKQWSLTVLLNRGNRQFAPPDIVPLAFVPRAWSVGDVNGDTRPDVVAIDGASTFTTLLGRGDSEFDYGPSFAAGSNLLASFLVLADVDGNRSLDVTVDNVAGGGVSVAFNDGHGNFKATVDVPMPDPPLQLGVGDVNGDGIPDLVGTSLRGNVMVLPGAGQRFGEVLQYPGGLMPLAAIAVELNGDKRQDVAVLNQWGAGLQILLSTCLR